MKDWVTETKETFRRSESQSGAGTFRYHLSYPAAFLAKSFIQCRSKGHVMDRNETVSTLNDLLKTTKDGQEGFRTCSQNVKDANLKAVFTSGAQRCDEGARELETTIRGLGGEPTDSGSISGSMHRAWTSLRSSITGMDDHAILAECERGEDSAESVYEKALQKDLPIEVKTIVKRQYRGVKENHDKIRDLRNAAA